MQALVIPSPGEPSGPCVETCGHSLCETLRRYALQPCIWCGNPIGYEVPFYTSPLLGMRHKACEEQAREALVDEEGSTGHHHTQPPPSPLSLRWPPPLYPEPR